jgi:C4-dicarboxylate-specific signal transduction histidine kinase
MSVELPGRPSDREAEALPISPQQVRNIVTRGEPSDGPRLRPDGLRTLTPERAAVGCAASSLSDHPLEGRLVLRERLPTNATAASVVEIPRPNAARSRAVPESRWASDRASIADSRAVSSSAISAWLAAILCAVARVTLSMLAVRRRDVILG